MLLYLKKHWGVDRGLGHEKKLLDTIYIVFLKVGLLPSKKICVICFIESPLKMMKNAFYVILKALFVLKIFKVWS